MNDQNQNDSIVSLDTAALEFATAYGLGIGKLVMDKLNLVQENAKLRSRIIQLEHDLDDLKQNEDDKG